jgi:predicted ATPase with chaperone activity
VWRLARTVADLEDGAPVLDRDHVSSALQFRAGRECLLQRR